MGAPDGTSGNFQSRARIKRLQDSVRPRAVATGTQKKKKRRRKSRRKRRRKKKRKKKKRNRKNT
jgi:hypothetical protein